MSLFRPYNYKNRPEQSGSALRKNRFTVFWEIYFRKFWRFVTLNLIYFLVTLPLLLYFYYTVNGWLSSVMGDSYTDLLPGLGFIAALLSQIPSFLYIPLLAVSAIAYGPVKMGFTYVYRNFTREEHAWISDVWAKAWENKKQGLALGLLDIAAFLLLTGNILGLSVSDNQFVGVILRMSRYISAVLMVVFIYIRHYSYIICVSVELPLRAVLKNSLLFVIMGFGRNTLSSLICLTVWVITLLTIPLLSIIMLPLLSFAFCGFATVYVCYPTVKKYLILPALQKQSEEAPEQ